MAENRRNTLAGKYKELVVINDANTPLYAVKFVGGGELPDVLKTLYTSTKEATKAIALYYKNKQKSKKVETS